MKNPLGTTSDFNNPEELLAVVDEHDREVGAATRAEVHRCGLLHRAVHVLVFRPNGYLIIQQRSPQKDTYPLHWECVGGHLAPGERYDEAAAREVEEELGIRVSAFLRIGKLPACHDTGHEFIEIYRATSDSPLAPNPSEIVAVDELPLSDLVEEVENHRRCFSPVFVTTLKAIGLIAPQTES
ncbi:MAG: hypothetical protein KatS3mg130_1790 [Candidatus Sumerlaea sp.]|nr:MAG: hypothetical protein KatS3mg130_1790 [Candidatus Sumerlaea sp.]